MIELATKYSQVPARMPAVIDRRYRAPAVIDRYRAPAVIDRRYRAPAVPAPNGRASVPNHGSAASPIPILKRPVWKDIDGMASALEAARQREIQKRTGVQILVPSFRKLLSHREWRWRELREGGALFHYLRMKRAHTADRWRGVARARASFRQNNKSDLQLVASVPAYDFHRWRRVDPDFWKDPKNIKALKRDNPNHVGSVYI